ncbi:MAG: molybdenum cofactor biosynthesis protein MoaE [Candidatus Hydrogenedentes bacterium]|nr:molybdenum cofactor biosynthesis protein MoaE [Candidatus Hydrogenedentota bacterium]
MFLLSAERIDTAQLKRALENPGAGACVTFEGWVRNNNEGKTVLRLEYEAYEDLALKEGARILAEALDKFGLLGATCVHRTGCLEIGELAVWVGVSAAHRDEAFAACRYIIDEVKSRVPIWKKEHYADGESGWVNCERCAAHGHDHAHGAGAAGILSRDDASYSRQTALP